jgi:hypothetical protein
MTREQAAKWIPLYQAYVDDKLDARVGDHWEPIRHTDRISWCNPPSDYRIRPEPREIWVWPDGTWSEKTRSRIGAEECMQAKIFREVLP